MALQQQELAQQQQQQQQQQLRSPSPAAPRVTQPSSKSPNLTSTRLVTVRYCFQGNLYYIIAQVGSVFYPLMIDPVRCR